MDEILIPDSEEIINGVNVKRYFLSDHNTNSVSLPDTDIVQLKGVTIHNTERIGGIYDNAMQYTAATLNDDMKDVRVHYYVDNLGAWQNLPLTSTSWHAADGTGEGNTGTISIECIMDSAENTDDLKSRDNAARLAAYILYSNGLDENSLYTHTHWLNVRDGIEGDTDYLNTLPNPYKNCPQFILPDWFGFKMLVKEYIEALKEEPVKDESDYFVEITADVLNVRSGAGTEYPVTARLIKGEVYRITETVFSSGSQWGKLDSGAGWINLRYTKEINN